MDKETRQSMKKLGGAWSLGLAMPLSIVLGLAAGLGLDHLFGTRPVCTIVGLLFGIAAAFLTLYRETKRLE
jgi:F0F1-type ATP synthase assembly protein I